MSDLMIGQVCHDVRDWADHCQTRIDVLWAYSSESKCVGNTDLCPQGLCLILSSLLDGLIPVYEGY